MAAEADRRVLTAIGVLQGAEAATPRRVTACQPGRGADGTVQVLNSLGKLRTARVREDRRTATGSYRPSTLPFPLRAGGDGRAFVCWVLAVGTPWR